MNADIVVKGIIFNSRLNRILLIQRNKNDPVGAGTWEGAGGNVEWGESPEEAVKREIKEETGITDIRIEHVSYVSLVNGSSPYLIVAYLCQTLTENVALSKEHQAFIWADKDDCLRLLPEAILQDFEKNNILGILEQNK